MSQYVIIDGTLSTSLHKLEFSERVKLKGKTACHKWQDRNRIKTLTMILMVE